jgi:ClpP class serine protease
MGHPDLDLATAAPMCVTSVLRSYSTVISYVLSETYESERAQVLIGDRIKKYSAIEDYRKRPLIVYGTSTRVGINAMMAADVVREFIDQINLINDGDKVDVLIHSTGGDALTAWKLMSLLRERFKNVAVLVPYMAFSAATIFALGADEIVMHPHASLGPIDPQIRMQDQNGVVRQFAYEGVP